MNRKELKNKAKESLKGKYGDAILLTLISLGISFAAGLIIDFLGFNENLTELLSNLSSVIISGLISFGTTSFYLKISRNESVTYKELFSKTSMFWIYIAISFVVGIFTILWSLLFIIPGIIAALSYSLVYYIKLDNPELKTMEVIKKSKALTFCILYLCIIPYISVTEANFYNRLKQQSSNI